MTRVNKKLALQVALLAMALITIAIPVSAGRVGGASWWEECVLANSTDGYWIMVCGGRAAQVVVDGDGDTDLDIYIYDQYGNLVDSDTDYTDYCIASWFPRYTGWYRIQIRNLGDVYNCYTVSTN